jgi:DNA (cytosine-5)-methyltransferase 1
MSAYYNEIDKFAAAWLRELIADGLIADGDVDERSILDVRPADLRGYDQCHFFAGIGGWSHALRLAGWPDDWPVWTGSCPCQPLSGAGQRKGHEDERHIWPAFYGLIAKCQPTTVFGEQIGSKLGLEWLAGVRADLESSGYACGAADLPAAGVGAPHIRQRLWWVADASSQQWGPNGSQPDAEANGGRHAGRNCKVGGVADANRTRRQKCDEVVRVSQPDFAGSMAEHWQGELIPCADGKARRAEPGIFPLADGVSNRVGTLRGAGNAIVPQVAREFVKAFMETT